LAQYLQCRADQIRGRSPKGAAWTTPQDIRRRYASASFLPQGVVIFNVKGNAYRLEATVAYRSGVVVIDWIGTHREYDERNKRR
jgi:mRNA interferase HigB